MNAVAHDNDPLPAPFTLAPALEAERFAESFRKQHHVRIPDVLAGTDALRLHEHLVSGLAWHTFLVSGGALYRASPGADGSYATDLADKMAAKARAGASNEFASFHEADRLFAEDVPANSRLENPRRSAVLTQFHSFANSPPFLDLCREVTGLRGIDRADIQATRFRQGHFVSVHHVQPYVADNGIRLAAFELNLTLEWRPEWGGLYSIHRGRDYTAYALVPSFNLLDIFDVRYARWIGQVTPLAQAERLSITGWLYGT